jgi:hypothetical protein
MTQAEKIKMLEAELKAERLEHEKAKAELEELIDKKKGGKNGRRD